MLKNRKKNSHIFIFANLVDDRINNKHYLGGEGGFAAATIQILNGIYTKNIPYTLAGQLGNDYSGKFLINTLQKLQVNTSGLSIVDTSTSQAITKGIKNVKFISFKGGSICSFTQEEFARFNQQLFSKGWLFLTSNTLYDQQTWQQVKKIITLSPRLIFFDINWRQAFLKRYSFCENTFIKNRVLKVIKASALLKGTTQELALVRKYIKFKSDLCVVETKGAEGATINYKGIKYTQLAPVVKEVQDTGAGDTFCGSMLFDFSLLGITDKKDFNKLSLKQIKMIIKNAVQVSALTVQGRGINHLNRKRKKLLDKN